MSNGLQATNHSVVVLPASGLAQSVGPRYGVWGFLMQWSPAPSREKNLASSPETTAVQWALAAAVPLPRDARQFTPLVLLRPGRNEPVFIVHGLGGDAAEFLELGKLIRSQRPIYGIQGKGVDGVDTPFDSITEMASYYLENIKQVQPCGPYILIGYSFGGMVAFEMAHQLLSAGQKVVFLALLDSYPHRRNWPLAIRICTFCSRAAERLRISAKQPLRQTIAFLVRRAKATGRERFYITEFPYAIQRMFEYSDVAWSRYQPRYYRGKVTFLKAGAGAAFPRDPRKIWRRLVEEFELHMLPGEHVELVGKNVEVVARRLSLCLDEVAG